MMVYYFDSSAAVKRYASEKGSLWVKDIVEPVAENVIYLGQIGVVEIAAALSKKVRTKELTPEDYEAALQLFLADVQNQEYVIASVNDQIIQLAVDLTKRHPLRGYDAVHLATAVSLNKTLLEAALPTLVFVTGDRILHEAAQTERLAVENPDEH
jgi:predicted nucleic acid-binding protein